MLPLITVAWTTRRYPLAPTEAVARGRAARDLALCLLSRSDDALARLRGVAGPGWICVSGDSDDLPWVDGVVYLGKDPLAPALRVPTSLEPSVPLGLLERGLLVRFGPGAPLAILVDPPACIALATERPLVRARLESWRGRATCS